MTNPPSPRRDGTGTPRGAPGAPPNGDRAADDSPGVPVFRTWRGVYGFVFGCFVIVVILLALFSRAYR